MVRKSILDVFIKKGGYTIVRMENGEWKNISEASRTTGLSRPTIYALLKQYPEEPEKGLPKYVEELVQSEGYRRYKVRYSKLRMFNNHVSVIQRAFVLLDKKDPLDWIEKDYEKLWASDKFVNAELGGVPESFATPFHNLMRVTGKLEFLMKFKGVKFPKGAKKEWFLEDEEIIKLGGQFTTNDCLMMLYLGIVKGARFSSLVLSVPEHINSKDLIMQDYEPKRKQYVSRLIPRPLMELLQRYIKDYDIKADEPLFTQSYSAYLDLFKAAGKAAGIRKTISTHILKHTYVTQASRHGISAENISEQTGTDFATLAAHYRAKDIKKFRHEMLGEPLDIIPFPDWIQSLHPYFVEAYERIRKQGGGLKLNGKT